MFWSMMRSMLRLTVRLLLTSVESFLLSVGWLSSLALLARNLATLFPGHRLTTLSRHGLAFLLRVVVAVLLGHVGAMLVPDDGARLGRHVLALLPLDLSGHHGALLA